MSPTTNHSYAFGGFALDPDERVLVYLNEPVGLRGRDLDVLVYMVKNPKRLITTQELLTAVWGSEPKIIARNITHHMAKVRKALDCDPRHPTFIETVNKKGYRFIVDVKQTDRPGLHRTPAETDPEKYLITSHMFVPVYLGEKAYESIQGKEKSSRWANYKEFPAEIGILCVMPSGVGVWHLTRTAKFESMSVIARWRRQAYAEILEGKHCLSEIARQIVENSGSEKGSLFPSKLSTAGYVFSTFVMDSPRWANTIKTKNALRLLACLTPLETKLKQRKEDEIGLERRILEEGFSERDMCEFGLSGTDVGFASWNGMSYYNFLEKRPGLTDDLIQFEVAVQAVWWFSKCLSDEMALATAAASAKPRFEKLINQLKAMFASVESIGQQETVSQRTMVEAGLTTSRLEPLVQRTIRQYEQI